MLRPFTVLRILFYGTLIWLALAVVWLALPSPLRNDDGTTYPTSVLRSGKTLTRTYKIERFFPYRGRDYLPVSRARDSDRERFSLTFAIDERRAILTISNAQKVSLSPQSLKPHVSAPIVISAPAGDLDGINPPWLNKADAALLFWMIHRDTATVTLRARCTDRVIEIWPDAESWNSSDPEPPAGILPLLKLRLAGEKQDFTASTPPPPQSSSPSSTYLIRAVILSIIAPTGLLVYAIFSFTGSAMVEIVLLVLQISGILIVVLGMTWLCKGRPEPRDFVAELQEVCGRLASTPWLTRPEQKFSSEAEKHAPNADVDIEKGATEPVPKQS